MFYREQLSKRFGTHYTGFPTTIHPWCKRLKDISNDRDYFMPQTDLSIPFLQRNSDETTDLRIPSDKRKLVSVPLEAIGNNGFSNSESNSGRERFYAKLPNKEQDINIVHYIGIANDEPIRIKRYIDSPNKIMPLVQIGWDEELCGLEAQLMDMLAPTYTDCSLRDGCWFCHNQGIEQLRRLRTDYPDLWYKLLKLDMDSPVTFHPDGHTVHDFDKRFLAESLNLIPVDKRFRWKLLDEYDTVSLKSMWLDKMLEVNTDA